MREIVHMQAGQCGNQIGAKVRLKFAIERIFVSVSKWLLKMEIVRYA